MASVKELMDSGVYKTVNEVHCAALADFVLKAKVQQKKLEYLNALLEKGKEDIVQGRCSTFESDDDLDEIFVEIEQRAKEKFNA